MGTRERAIERGQRTAERLLRTLGAEARVARRDRNLSLRTVAAALGVDAATVWRFETGHAPRATLEFIARLFAIVGLDLSARAFPGPTPIRDAPQAALLTLFLAQLHVSVLVGTEVPLPNPGDQRRWDALLRGPSWRFGTELETGPTDAQALAGRLTLKQRDGEVDGVLLVLPYTKRVDAFLAGAHPVLDPIFPVPGVEALEALRRGAAPAGNSIIVLRRSGRAVGDARGIERNKDQNSSRRAA